MEEFETTLTGSDGLIDGIVTTQQSYTNGIIYQFISLDETLQLTIAKDSDGKWSRLTGTDPYFPGWVDELAERISEYTSPNSLI
jgi:hypothetical protein